MPAQAHTAPARQLGQVRQILSLHAVTDHEDEQDQVEISLASILSSDLLRGQKAVSIRHNGSIYRLQATRLGKLILTK
jgi:hemin uptake protein HemP